MVSSLYESGQCVLLIVCAHAVHQAHNRDTSIVHSYQWQVAQLAVSLDLGAFAPAAQDFADVPSVDGWLADWAGQRLGP